MREVQKRISALKPYVLQMGFHGQYVTVDAAFKPKWVILDNDKVKVTPNNDGKSHKFYAIADQVDIDEVLDLIESIIGHNQERENKLQLLKMKAEELKLLFNDKSLAELERLKFVFEEPEIRSEDDINFDELPTKYEGGDEIEENGDVDVNNVSVEEEVK